MGKEKNVQPTAETEKKKEQVSILEKIRRRTGLLVGIVGLALIIFILESLLGSGASIFGGNEMSTLGSINGKKIDRNEFAAKLEYGLNNYRQRNQSNDIDEGVRASIIDNIWQQYVSELVIKPQFDKIGITVGDDEVYQRVVANPVQEVMQQISDPKTGRVNDQIARPDGSLDLLKWKQVIQNLPADQEAGIRQIEENVKNTRFYEKYKSIITKGLYLTTAEAKLVVKEQFSRMNGSFVIKRYNAVDDSTIKVNDDDIKKYYKENTYQFTNPETTRKVEYVVFNVLPSNEDLMAIEKDAQRVASEFKGKSLRDDSIFIQQESENGIINIQDFTKKTLTIRDSSIYTASAGSVFGPYNEGAYFKVYKLEAINSVADSAKVRHILIGLNDPKTQQPKRGRSQAKKEADSLLVLIKNKNVTFDTLVKTISDDFGSVDKGGDYGWFDESKGFVAPFKNAGLMGTKGNISVVETQFGFHIIEVLDVSKNRHTSYSVAQIGKPIVPSDETNQKVFAEANQFGGVNNTAELFDKGVETQKLAKRIADNIKEGDRQLPGLSQAKDLVRWAYGAKNGEVNTFSFTDKHIVAKLANIRNKGLLPLEEVKDEVTTKAIQKKKEEQFLAEFKNKTGASKNIEDIAAKLGLELKKVEALQLNARSVDGLGDDYTFVGTAGATKAGTLSKPTASKNGVFVLAIDNVNSESGPPDFNKFRKLLEQGLYSRRDNDIMNALKEISDIQDHKSRID